MVRRWLTRAACAAATIGVLAWLWSVATHTLPPAWAWVVLLTAGPLGAVATWLLTAALVRFLTGWRRGEANGEP